MRSCEVLQGQLGQPLVHEPQTLQNPSLPFTLRPRCSAAVGGRACSAHACGDTHIPRMKHRHDYTVILVMLIHRWDEGHLAFYTILSHFLCKYYDENKHRCLRVPLADCASHSCRHFGSETINPYDALPGNVTGDRWRLRQCDLTEPRQHTRMRHPCPPACRAQSRPAQKARR